MENLPADFNFVPTTILFHETFPLDLPTAKTNQWIESNKNKNFKTDWYKHLRRKETYGLVADKPNSKYAISSKINPPTGVRDFQLLFDLAQQNGQTCGEYQVKLFGTKNYAPFHERTLTDESLSLLTFGVRVCDWVAGVEIKFMSAMDNSEHRSESVIVPPNDDKVHTYRLDWLSSID